MPFLAKHHQKDTEVTPNEVERGVDVYCTDCGGRMRVWRSFEREDGTVVVRHFHHIGDMEDVEACGASGSGEGSQHKRCKSIAKETLKKFFTGGKVRLEREFESERPRAKQSRLADVVVEFETGHERFGKGIVVEIQDRHEDKNVFETSCIYLENGYSVVWLSPNEFGKHSLNYSRSEFKALVATAQPDATSVFSGVLNEDGTVPNKDKYPLSASVWPNAVTEERKWSFLQGEFDDARTLLQDLSRQISLGRLMHREERMKVPAKIPSHWFMPTAKEHWKNTDWNDRFRVENQRSMRDYILQVAVGSQPSSVTVPATLHRDWLLPTPAEYWRSEPWFRRFSSTHVYPFETFIDDGHTGETPELHRKIPFSEWVRKADGDRPEQIVAAVLAAYNEGKLDPPNTEAKRSEALETVKSVVRHHSSDDTGISIHGLLTVASSYIGLPSDHVRWAVGKLKSEGIVAEDNGQYRLSQ